MNSKKIQLLCCLIPCIYAAIACKQAEELPPGELENFPSVTVSIDQNRIFQTIEGFGFFGAKDAWWRQDMWDSAWGDKVISDLGITIWRNEIYPPGADQDTDWEKQRPVVAGLKSKADQYNVDLKFVATVWSPPADMKWNAQFAWAGDEEATRWADPTITTKNGGTLNPNKYDEYADYLNQHIQLYRDAGVDLYALSLQNEPAFSQPFNSCTYTTFWYNDLLINVVPSVKERFPDVQIFGAEHMLAMEGKEINWRWFYHSAIKANPMAASNVDILAVHGYSDGVMPNSGSELVDMWKNHVEQFSDPLGKRAWMTETSGYAESWEAPEGKSGAFSLASDMMTALVHGNISAWIWWQGSELDGIDEFNLMNGVVTGNKYYVSKHYYRFIRPGAQRLHASSSDDDVYATAFKHEENGTMTVVIINAGEAKLVSLSGDNIPSGFEMYRTSAAASENCTLIPRAGSENSGQFVLPAKSIVTLQAGGNPL